MRLSVCFVLAFKAVKGSGLGGEMRDFAPLNFSLTVSFLKESALSEKCALLEPRSSE